MPDGQYLVRFNDSSLPPQLVKASTVEVHGEHLAFLLSSGELSALFLLETVKDWEKVER